MAYRGPYEELHPPGRAAATIPPPPDSRVRRVVTGRHHFACAVCGVAFRTDNRKQKTCGYAHGQQLRARRRIGLVGSTVTGPTSSE